MAKAAPLPANPGEAIKRIASIQTTRMTAASVELMKVVEQAKFAVTQSTELEQVILQRQEELAALDTQFDERERQLQADLGLRMKERESAAVLDILNGQGKIAVSREDYATLTNNLTTLKANFDQQLATQVAEVKKDATAGTNAAIRMSQLENEKTNAEQKANLGSAQIQIKQLEATIANYVKQLDNERSARIEEAKARGTPMVNVTSGK